MTKQIISPTEFFGHEMGAKRKLERWDRIVDYFWHLDTSPCVKVVERGSSTEGNPFLLAIKHLRRTTLSLMRSGI